MKLYSAPLSMFGAKAEIAAHEKRVSFDLEFVPFSISTLYDPKHPEVRRINPKQQVPVLVDDGLELFDSTQIFEYLEDRMPTPPLWPGNAKDRARARQLELKSDEVFFPNVIALMPRQRAAATDAQVADAIAALARYYDDMERQLEGRDYLAGSFSYADIAFYMAQFFAAFLGQPWAPGHPRLDGWRARMAARQSVKSVAGRMAQYLRGLGVQPQEV
jgi:glutathione S-transferase